MALSNKQRVFVEEYLRCWNATEAAIRAGYSEKTARSIGSENLTKPDIQEEIKLRVSEKIMTANEVLIRLAEQARANINDFVYLSSDGQISGFNERALEERGHLIKKISTSEGKTTSLSIELYDAQTALSLIGKHLMLFVDRTEHTGEGGGPIKAVWDWQLEKSE